MRQGWDEEMGEQVSDTLSFPPHEEMCGSRIRKCSSILPDPAADEHSQHISATSSDVKLAHTASKTEHPLTLADICRKMTRRSQREEARGSRPL